MVEYYLTPHCKYTMDTRPTPKTPGSRVVSVLTQLWDFVDSRDIDKHAASVAIMYGTMTIIHWAMEFASAHSDKSGLEIAAIIAAVSTPYMGLQTAALAFYFKARTPSQGTAPSSPTP